MTDASPHAELFENLRIELRSGCLILAVLGQLRAEHYGYSLRQALAQAGLEIEENTLYPMLRRLEKQGLLESEWREENNRKKRFYQLSTAGKRLLPELFKEWDGIERALSGIRAEARKR
ncbi:MAG TPA: helix-turn-helix transcriptional regulator [Steroidobacteraceae bacterium]|nr:helix-turn-helix transcriptional regulator [Steroidobacteraceae bacterium]